MASKADQYRLRNGDDIGDQNVLNRRFLDIDLRLTKQEEIEKTWAAALDEIAQFGLLRVNEVMQPAYLRVIELSQLGAIFTAHSATDLEISVGLKRWTIDESERASFAPAAFIAAFADDDIAKAMLGIVVGYDVNSGELAVQVTKVAGSGTSAGWTLHAASATDNAAAAAEALQHKQNAESARDLASASATTATDARDGALDAQTISVAAATSSAGARDDAEAARDLVLASLASFDQLYLGAFATDPVLDNQGGPLQIGMLYWNTSAGEMRVFKGAIDGFVAAYIPSNSVVDSVFGRVGAVGAADGDYNAAQIVVTPVGGITQNRVQAALAGLDTAKAAKATTLAGYGITNAYTKTEVDTAIGGKADAATTIAGYGITDAYTQAEVDSALAAKLNTADVVNNLTTNDATKALSAAQGKALKDQIDGLGDVIVVANTTERNALTGLDKGDLVHVVNDGAAKWVRYQITAAGDGAWGSATKVAIWTQDQAPATHQHVIGDVTGLQTALDAKAALASPTFTGTPTAPTPAVNDQSQKIATTDYVISQAGTGNPVIDGTAAPGTSKKFAREDHIHPTDTSRAPASRSIGVSGLLSGGGDLSANRTIGLAAASQAQAEAGADNTTAMTPLRTAQAIAVLASGGGAPHVIIEDQKTNGTNGGTFTAGARRTRELNTLVRNADSLASLSSDQFTLPAGSYFITWSAPAVTTPYHKSWLRNVTDGADVATGTVEGNGSSSSGTGSRSEGSAVLEIAETKTFAIEHRCSSTQSSNGLGGTIAAVTGIEVYTRVEIWRL